MTNKLLVLGIDQSITQTGFAFYQVPGDERTIECGSFSSDDAPTADEKCSLFGRHLKNLIGPLKREIAFVCWEMARSDIAAYPKKDIALLRGSEAPYWTVNSKQLLLPEIQGQIRQCCIDYRIPYEAVPVSTWRAALWPGQGHIGRDAAKAKAKEYCRMLGIRASNENEAEAACIARWAATCSTKFKMLRFRLEAAA